MKRNNIIVIGMGYVGIPIAVVLAETEKSTVIGIQRNSKRSGWKIASLNSGKSPFPDTEPVIAELIAETVLKKKTFSVDSEMKHVEKADAVIITVQTPIDPATKQPLYQNLFALIQQIGKMIKQGVLISIESTLAPGTTKHLLAPLLEQYSGFIIGEDIFFAHCYERVMPGKLVKNIKEYPRVIGGYSEECAKRAALLYEPISFGGLSLTDCTTAEIAKTVENAYRDINIAFANEVSTMCESLGTDVYTVRELVNNFPFDPSSSQTNPYRNMLFPGTGVGGHCLPKDPWLLLYGLQKFGAFPVETDLIKTARKTNDSMPNHLAELILQTLQEKQITIETTKIVILGYAYLRNSDDTRNTPVKHLKEILNERGVGTLIVHDPYVDPDEGVTRNLESAVTDADCICIATNHSVYEEFNFLSFQTMMRTRIIVDGRNTISKKHKKELLLNDFTVVTLGVGKPKPPDQPSFT